MRHFDVVVVGAGPSGGHCARQLAKSGKKVLLAEQHQTFAQNDFSSGAIPIETLKRYNLPSDVVGSLWQKIVIITTNIHQTWECDRPRGVVLNFAKLREFLAQEVQRQGSEVWMGHRYIQSDQENGKTIVEFKPYGNSETVKVSTQVLVDATGQIRAVMCPSKQQNLPYLTGTGTEYLIEVGSSDYQKYAQKLTFFLGHKWMPKGYSWIFPMEPNRLKIGSARLNRPHKIVEKTSSLRTYIELIINDYLQGISYKIIDVHGGVLKYCSGLQDTYYRNNVIAIGDAVSTVNMLGGEGIRHGIESAEIASRFIEAYLAGQQVDFSSYQQEMHKTYKKTWDWSERMGISKYLEYSDKLIDRGVSYLNQLSTEEILQVLFEYNFNPIYRRILPYLRYKLSAKIRNLIGQVRSSFTNINILKGVD
ncbi:FAD binding domain protein [Lyngbya aestuarii BL J]|uniref:FAD binding domain protein n=1 Tax=Lyngbya aestuarii BL J TaxID=1348334 RepID=U7QD90_9CYAN|nr:NAD(P)/FAD-dependent oxidoreductase [Lyngbya aestuarii]ERT05839.1 FAD binding domain protein [Lyngbya aestuarii BL J]